MKRKSNPTKDAKVKAERGFAPAEIVEGGELLDVYPNPNHKGQEIEVYFFNGDVWVVVAGLVPPRLITAYKSSKLKKRYGK